MKVSIAATFLLCVGVSCVTTPDVPLFSESFRLTLQNGRYVSDGYVNSEPVVLLWDTGSALSVFDKSRPIALEQKKIVQFATAEVSVVSWLGHGTFDQGDASVSVEGNQAESEVFGESQITGLLGGNQFADHLVVFDFPDRLVTITDRELSDFDFDNKFNFEFDVADGVPLVHVKIGGAPYKALIDTGDDGLVSVYYPKTVPHDQEAVFRGEIDRNFFRKQNESITIKVQSLEILGEIGNGVCLSDGGLPFHFADSEGKVEEGRQDNYTARIGMKFLKTGILALDYRTRRGFWRPNAPAVFEKKILPFFYNAKGVITAVNVSLPHNPFNVGDKLISVDRVPFDSGMVLGERQSRIELERAGAIVELTAF